jgi:hypothetical protein
MMLVGDPPGHVLFRHDLQADRDGDHSMPFVALRMTDFDFLCGVWSLLGF